VINLFHEILRELRKDKNMSQEDITYQLDVSRQSVSKWESGVSMPDLENVIKLSKLFDVSIDYLLTNRKSDSEFNYYTIEQKEFKRLSHFKIICVVFLTLAIATMVTLLAISLLEPMSYYDGNTGNEYSGFMGYYYTYSEFRTVVITSFIVIILAIIGIFIPEEKFLKLFQKKI